MKQIHTWLLIIALVLLLLPSSLLAADYGEETSSIEVGAAGMAIDDEVNRVNEYTVIRDDDGANPYADVRIKGGEEGVYFDLEGRAMGERDQEYNLEADINRIFRVNLEYDTFKHWLPHDQLDYMRATMKTEAQTAPGSANPAIYSEDLVPGKDFFIIHREFESEGEVQLPSMPNVTLRAGFRQEEREGVEQVFGISHCSACHVTGDAKDVDEKTTDVTVGATGKFGLLTLDYEYLTRDFEENASGVTRDYLLAAKPEDGLPIADFATKRLLFDQQNGELPYENTPESEKDSHTLKARVDLANNTVISGGYINADIESKKKDTQGLLLSKNELSTEYDSYNLRASTRLGGWRLTGFGRHESIESSDNILTFQFADDSDVPTTLEKATYESHEARDITTLGGNAVYRLSTYTSLRLGYEYEEIEREVEVHEDTETHTFKASLRTRPAKGLNGRVNYTYQSIDNQFLNPHGNKGPINETFVYLTDPKAWYGTSFYTLREAEATNLPEDVHDLKASLTWTPSARYSVTVYGRYHFEENDLNFNTYEKTVYSPGFSVWWAPLNDLNLTMAYNFDKQYTENQMCVGWYHG